MLRYRPVVLVSQACLLSALFLTSFGLHAQTASTGAVRGTVSDPSGALVEGAHAKVTILQTGEVREADSHNDGSFVVPLLPPGSVRIEVSKSGFRSAVFASVTVNVTETRSLTVSLKPGEVASTVEVTAQTSAIHAEGTALGDVVPAEQVTGLPLVTRNFTQIIGLSAGVTNDVTNAGEAGRGSGSVGSTTSTTGNTFAHGDRGYDNDFQINGLQVNDAFAQGTASGGIPVPNPDTIQEFKVQTAQYDAAFGRKAGANVDLITRSGSNGFHGTLFEFFRNTALDANDYFSKLNKQNRPQLNQNQFGATLGGPVVKNRLFFFGAYQGTRQINAVANVKTVTSPAFTNDRSAAALGALFAGQRGYYQNAFGGRGPAILANGSNINPAALVILQAKLPNGQYLVPTPQTVTSSGGSSSFAPATHFNEDQYMANGDYQLSESQHIGARMFTAGSDLLSPEVFGNLPAGYSQNTHNRFVVSSLEHDWVLSPRLVNQFRVGFNRTTAVVTQNSPFSFSDFGITAPAQNNSTPAFTVSGSYALGGAAHGKRVQNLFLADETLAWSRGRHSFRFGGGTAYFQRNFSNYAYGGQLTFLTWPDFLLGLTAAQDGFTAPFPTIGNIYTAVMVSGIFNRSSRIWETYTYAQDDWRLLPNLNINLGLRYDWLPPATDASGRQTNVDINRVNPNPGATGSLAGLVVPNNFSGSVPAGVTRTGGGYILSGKSDGVFGPRIGFSWQPFGVDAGTVVRGGYGVYYARITGQVQSQGATAQPFGNLTANGGPAAGTASFQNPFLGVPTTFPTFTPYSSSTALSATVVDNNARPGIIQQASFNVQQEIPKHWVLELGTVGSRGTHMLRTLSRNQALLASQSSPIRGVTTNTVANVSSRVPFQGFSTTGLNQVQSEGAFWYNDLEATLRKHFAHGMQMQVAYTWSKTLDTDALNTVSSSNAGSGVGNAIGNHTRYGQANFSRPHRLVVSYVYELPFYSSQTGFKGHAFGGWGISGVTTIQAGHTLTVVGTNSNNVYGVTGTGSDYAQLASGCSTRNEGAGGSVQHKLGTTVGRASYFNNACFFTSGTTRPAYPIIGDDGIGTDFGNSGIGVVRGPAQNNYDISILKRTRLPLDAASNLEFRVEMFNAFNQAQFSDPDTNVADGTSFGSITTTSVSPRVVQLALKVNF